MSSRDPLYGFFPTKVPREKVYYATSRMGRTFFSLLYINVDDFLQPTLSLQFF